MRLLPLVAVTATLFGCPENPVSALDAARASPDAAAVEPIARPSTGPRLLDVGPRYVSNQTPQPLALYGEELDGGTLTVKVAGTDTLEISTSQISTFALDARHLYARLPPIPLPPQLSEAVATLSLSGAAGTVELRLINDAAFPELIALEMSPDGKFLFAASQTEDALYVFEVATKKVTRLDVLDGPSALATYVDSKKQPYLIIGYRYAPSLTLLSLVPPFDKRRDVPTFGSASALSVDGDTVYVAEQARDTVAAFSLPEAKEKWRTPVLPNPRALRASSKGVFVGSEQSGIVERLDAKSGAVLEQVAPRPGTKIVGGGTAGFEQYVMGGSAPRDFVWSKRDGRLYEASIGPNIGPNPKRMEVSMNGGVSVIVPPGKGEPSSTLSFHLGFGAGVTEALALDDAHALLYAADVSLGLVRVLDTKKLASAQTAGDALLQEVALPPPDGFPLIRPAADFGVKNRAGVSLHSGPWALSLSPDGKTLWALNRFTATLAFLDVSQAAQKKAVWVGQTQLTSPLTQPTRRRGQVLYFADLGRSAMSCDACHPDGHLGDVMFEKTRPMRIYRSSTVRGGRATPPYFTPASTFSMGQTAEVVGGRNRFHNPNPTVDEINALSIYCLDITLQPNPFVEDSGAPPETLSLPDGKTGHPRAGIAAFEKAQCKGCHPPPHFTTDQDQATRGRYVDAGTPELMPLRVKMQDPFYAGFAVPSLLGSWDVWPMLTTGTAGWAITDAGALQVDERYPARKVLTAYGTQHGRADLLSEQERDDLLAWLMTL